MYSPSPQRLVLLAEDSPTDVRLITSALKDAGFPLQVDVAGDGEEAMQRLNRSSGNPSPLDLILLDVKLPKYNGFELLQEIRSQSELQLVPVIMMTSSDDVADMRDSYRHGANGYVCKSFDPDVYRKRVTILASYWLGINISSRHRTS